MPKRLELLSELVPQARVIVLLANPNSPSTERVMRDVQEAAPSRGAAPYPQGRQGKRDRRRLRNPVRLQAGALVVGNNPFFTGRRDQLVASASRHAARRCISPVNSPLSVA
jgi:putative tryptophan/tyrosine transport system substrate-binding protein